MNLLYSEWVESKVSGWAALDLNPVAPPAPRIATKPAKLPPKPWNGAINENPLLNSIGRRHQKRLVELRQQRTEQEFQRQIRMQESAHAHPN